MFSLFGYNDFEVKTMIENLTEKLTEESYELYNKDNIMIAQILFPKIENNLLCITHTFVDPCLRGMGVASELVEKVIEVARLNGYQITATCSYARSYFAKNPNDIYIIKSDL